MWRALHEVLPSVRTHGCFFHWSQAVWRKVKELGLALAYYKKGSIHSYIKMLMSLPFLPQEHIAMAMSEMKLRAASPCILDLCKYIEKTWVNGKVWLPDVWTVFQRPFRTNNDVEGWHRRFNSLCGENAPPLYKLIVNLFKEVQIIKINIRLISEGKLKKRQKNAPFMQAKIFSLWDKYTAESLSTSKFLQLASEVNTII